MDNKTRLNNYKKQLYQFLKDYYKAVLMTDCRERFIDKLSDTYYFFIKPQNCNYFVRISPNLYTINRRFKGYDIFTRKYHYLNKQNDFILQCPPGENGKHNAYNFASIEDVKAWLKNNYKNT